MTAGFIGLGKLGTAMVRRLLNEGITLRVWNRTREKAKGLPVEWADTPAILISGVEVVFLNLFDSDAVEEVLTMPNGLLQGTCCGKVIVDTTTNHPEKVLRFHELLKAQAATYLEAPVLGSVGPASQGALTMLVSGERHGLNVAMPYIEKLCKYVRDVHTPGVATRLKLINNLVLGTFMAVLAEAVALGERLGISRETVLDVLATGAGNSGVLTGKKEKLARGEFSATFTSAAILKDLRYLDELCRGTGESSILGAPVRDLYARAVEEGIGDEDFAAVYKVLHDAKKVER